MKLLIVESPTKAKTLTRFLGKDYEVMATMGHIRDLPGNAMNIDMEAEFKPHYELIEGKGKVVAQLQRSARKASEVLLAMDPDREGEAIAYHVRYILQKSLKDKVKGKFKRITFHQITKAAVEEAIAHAGGVNQKLFEAQQARRVLDRLVGYSLSPVLWRKVRRGLSAGRVQSVALRLVVEREREIEKFKPQEYWEIGVLLSPTINKITDNHGQFWTSLHEANGKKIVEGKGDDRRFLVNTKDKAEPIIADLKKAHYQVSAVIRTEKKSSPKPPYTTSTMQQAASNNFGWTAKRVMSVAQKLYEKGLITYHRTDSLHLAPEAVNMAREFIHQKFGTGYLPEKPRFYKTQSKSAQEAHEAIRPTDTSVNIDAVDDLDSAQRALYQLIWKKFVASQMVDAIIDATSIDVTAQGKGNYLLRATGSVIKFEGWRAVYGVSEKQKAKSKDQGFTTQSDDVELPLVSDGEVLDYQDMHHEQKFTQPPPRYNDASLVKSLEELGIGRPSTYAPTISTLITRGYMERVERRFIPTAVGSTVVDFLLKNFDDIMDYGFTAEMETDLDRIAAGDKEWVPMMKTFWKPFEKKVKNVAKNADRVKVPVEKLDKPCPQCGKEHKGELVVRTGRFGKFISCSRFPDCRYTAKLENKIKGLKCPTCEQGDVILRKSKKGRSFYGCSRYPQCDWASWNDPRQKEGDTGKKPMKKYVAKKKAKKSKKLPVVKSRKKTK